MRLRTDFKLYGLFLLLAFLLSCVSQTAKEESPIEGERNQDKYKNFDDLAAHEKLGVDYQITVVDRKNAATVFAIHGGEIDKGTSILAKSVAGEDFNLYLFEGIKPKDNYDLHVTSSHFDEPKALGLASRSKQCLSMHGHKNSAKRICLGGNNLELKAKIYSALKEKNFPFQIDLECPNLNGSHVMNIVNRCPNKGVQFEFSSTLRKTLFSDGQLLKEFSDTVRNSLNSQ